MCPTLILRTIKYGQEHDAPGAWSLYVAKNSSWVPCNSSECVQSPWKSSENICHNSISKNHSAIASDWYVAAMWVVGWVLFWWSEIVVLATNNFDVNSLYIEWTNKRLKQVHLCWPTLVWAEKDKFNHWNAMLDSSNGAYFCAEVKWNIIV